jgi:hypothetical protein
MLANKQLNHHRKISQLKQNDEKQLNSLMIMKMIPIALVKINISKKTKIKRNLRVECIKIIFCFQIKLKLINFFNIFSKNSKILSDDSDDEEKEQVSKKKKKSKPVNLKKSKI